MSKRKVVTLCGSVRFWDKIQEMYEKLELEKGIRSNWNYTTCNE